MGDLARIAAVTAGALIIVAALVFGAGDRTVLVPPPESVVEQFGRELATHRYDLALGFVEPASGISATTVRLGAHEVEAECGVIERVSGEEGSIQGELATAEVVFHGTSATVRHRFTLALRHGLWKITSWREE